MSPPGRSSPRRCWPTTRTSRAGVDPPDDEPRRRHLPAHRVRVPGRPQALEHGAPVLGEDNDYVFRKVLQLDDEEYQRYVDAKVIVDDYLDADMNPV